MDIRIKTATEFRDAHVTIEICAADQGEAETVIERLSPATLGRLAGQEERIIELEAELSEAQGKAHAFNLDRKSERDRADKLTTDLERYRKAHVCTSRCSEKSHVAFEGNRIMRELADERDRFRAGYEMAQEELKQARREITELNDALVVHRQRAADSREWAERAETRLTTAGLKLVEAERSMEALSTQIARISSAVHNPHVHHALAEDGQNWSEGEAIVLAGAIRAVRDALGSASLPSSPVEPTSQA